MDFSPFETKIGVGFEVSREVGSGVRPEALGAEAGSRKFSSQKIIRDKRGLFNIEVTR